MSKDIVRIKGTGRLKNRDLKVTEFMGPDKTGAMIQLTQGFANHLDDNDEPGFIQLSKGDAKVVIEVLQTWVEGEK